MKIVSRIFAVAAVVLLASAGPIWADASSATLTGQVKDQTDAALPGVAITVKDEARGSSSTATTNNRGEYRIPLLRPDFYSVTAELAGFKTETRTHVQLSIGRDMRLDFKLGLATTASVTASAEAPLLDTSSAQVGFNVNPKQIETLPLNNRSYLELALMAPGVSFARDNTSNSPLAFGAQEGRAVNVQVDGVDNNDESVGGQETDINQDTVQEFQVVSSQFTAEYGKASGGIINVITKSGTNDFHGSAYYYLRRDSLDAHDFFAQEQPKLTKDNYGATLGGPIVPNSTFFFVSGDYSKKLQATTVDTGGALPEADGTFPLPDKHTLASVKIDHQLADNNHLTVGYHLDNQKRENLYVGGIYALSYGYAIDRKAWGANASMNTVFSGKSYNEFRFGYLYNKNNDIPNSTAVGEHHPDFYIGQNYFMPQSAVDKKYQIADTYTMHLDLAGDHQLKVGASYAHWHEDSIFSLTSGGSIFYGSDGYDSPIDYLVGYGNPNTQQTVKFYAGFIQDQWKMKNLTLNIGIRYDYEPGQANAGFKSAYPFIGTAKEDKTQFAPRFGFAFDPAGDGKSVFRGGGGLFYYQLYNNLALDQNAFNGTTYRIADFECDGSPNAPAFCTANTPPTRSQLPDPTQGQPTPPLIRTLNPNIKTPYTLQYSLGYQRQFGDSWAVAVDLLYIRGLHELYERDLNVIPNRYWPVIYDQVGRIRQINSDASSTYKAVELTLQKRLTKNFQFQAAYTLSKAENETDGFWQPIPDSDKPISFQKGPALADQRHRFVLNGTYNLPWGFQASGIWKIASGQPYDAQITGGDVNGDGARHDRLPGDHRNDQLSNMYNRFDLRLSKVFNFGPVGVTLIAEVFNLFNRRNYDPGQPGTAGGYDNHRCLDTDVTASGQCVNPNPSFGTPGPPGFPDNFSQRELQFAARISF
jgi:hypothetical protein